jgi:hypothetical protein
MTEHTSQPPVWKRELWMSEGYCHVTFPSDSVEQACSTFHVVLTASTRFSLHSGSMHFNTENEQAAQTYSYMQGFTCVFLYSVWNRAKS